MDWDAICTEYHRAGFVQLRAFWPLADMGHIRAAMERYIQDVVPGLPAEDRVLEADGKSVRNLWRMQAHDDFFARLAERVEITALVERLVQGRPVLMAVESFCKPARVGSAVPYHQDNAYFCQTPPDVLTVWVALDQTNEANGAVRYIPGSHRQGVLPHQPSFVQGNSFGLAAPPDPATTVEVCAEMQPGDIVIHHSEVIHRSTPNTSANPRRGLLLVYRGEHTQTDPRLQAAYDAARAALNAK